MHGETPTRTAILFPLNIEARIPATHPLRRIKRHAEAMRAAMSPTFDVMYSRTGRLSIPPERLLKAHVLLALFTIRGERRLSFAAHAFVEGCRERGITPHVARKKRGTSLDDAPAATAGYAMNRRIRKTIEKSFGWAKTTGNFRKTRVRGIDKVQMAGCVVATVKNVLRIARLLAARELDTGPPGIPVAAQIPVAA